MFNWFDKLLVKIAKKILNKYAPTGEFIAYINEQEEKVLKKLGGYGQPVNETGVKSFKSVWQYLQDAKDYYDEYKDIIDPIVKVGTGLGKAWIDMNEQERKNVVTEKAYNDYMAQVEAAGKEAESAVALNLTPMTISNVPTTKADVSDFTAVAAHGGLMNLPTRQRKRYAKGPDPEDIPIMDDLSPPFDPREEGVIIGEQVFYDTGKGDRSNAMQIWSQMENPDKAIFDFDFEIFFMDGGWSDQIKSEVEVEGDTRTASAPSIEDSQNEMAMNLFGKPYHQLNQEELDILNEQGAAPSANGIMQVAKGGRIGYKSGTDIRNKMSALMFKLADGSITKEEMIELRNLESAAGFSKAHGGRIGYASGSLDKLRGLSEADTAAFIAQVKIYMGHGMSEEDAIEEVASEGWAKGGRIRKAPGGIMNLGGLEKDYRTTGGFVPLGGRERADDVPARLSKNEFVMTADAVRAAGGGSINRGAQQMYNVMKNLEARPTSKRRIA